MEREPSTVLFDVYRIRVTEYSIYHGHLIYTNGDVYAYSMSTDSPVLFVDEAHVMLPSKRKRASVQPYRRLSPQMMDELRALLVQPERDRGDPNAVCMPASRDDGTALVVDAYVAGSLPVRLCMPCDQHNRLLSLLQMALADEGVLMCACCKKPGANSVDTADHKVYCEEPCGLIVLLSQQRQVQMLQQQQDARVAPPDTKVMMMRPENGRQRRQPPAPTMLRPQSGRRARDDDDDGSKSQ